MTTDKTPHSTQMLDLIAVSEFDKHYSFLKISTIRQLIFKNTNGFKDKVIRLIGKRLYIKVSALEQWIEESGKVA